MPLVLALAVLSVGLSSAYLLYYCKADPSPAKSFVKTAAVLPLAAIAFLLGAPWLLWLGLAFCALGDYFLARGSERMFLAGMAAFALGHLCYVALFFNEATGGINIVALLVLAVFGAGMARLLWPHLGELRGPVMGYILVILAMGVTAFGLPSDHPQQMTIIGAVLFMASDAILSMEMFYLSQTHKLRRITPYAVWSLYWGGNVLILLGML